MIQVKDLLKADYRFTQKIVFEYPFDQQNNLDNETLLTNPTNIMLDIMEEGYYAEDFMFYIIEVYVPEKGNDSSYNIHVDQRDMIDILEKSDTVDDFRGFVLNY